MPHLMTKQRGVRREANFTGRPGTTWGTALASDAVAHTEPATETQLIASTAFDTDMVRIWFHTNNAVATNTASLVNIKVGAAGSEQTIIPNLTASCAGAPDSQPKIGYSFPLRIPAGSRVSATHRSVRTATSLYCMIELLGGGDGHHWVGTAVEAVGANTADSGGTPVTLGTTAEGTLTSIGTNTYDWGYIVPGIANNGDTAILANLHGWDIASGSATSDLIPGLERFLTHGNASEFFMHYIPGRYLHIPAGTTLYARGRTSGSAEDLDVILYGVY